MTTTTTLPIAVQLTADNARDCGCSECRQEATDNGYYTLQDTNPLEVDVPRLDAVLSRITLDPETFEMATYVSVIDPKRSVLNRGTSACLAGWVVLLEAGVDLTQPGMGLNVRPEDVYEEDWESAVAHLLGLGMDDATRLCAGHNDNALMPAALREIRDWAIAAQRAGRMEP